LDVFPISHGLHVIGIDAIAPTTEMIDYESFTYGASIDLKGQSMRLPIFPAVF